MHRINATKYGIFLLHFNLQPLYLGHQQNQFLSSNVQREEVAIMAKVVVFTKDNCIQCKMTKRFLNAHNVDFEERNINQHPELIDYLKGRGFQAMPVVDADGVDAVSGFRPDVLAKLA
jgi:glutaredoxin-like protein NrdH